MTTPTEGEPPANPAGRPEPAPPPPPAAPAADPPHAGPPHAGPPPGWGGPFAMVPRVPWVNPQRRSEFVLGAIIAGLVVLGAGFGIGYAVAPSGSGHGVTRIQGGYPPRLVGPYGRLPNRQFPNAPGRPAATGAPTPSATK